MTELLVNNKPIRYDLVPVRYMEDGLRLYLEDGTMPGDFMEAILRNDLMTACAHADATNKHNIFQWAEWLYNYAPMGSYGSSENVQNWSKQRQAARLQKALVPRKLGGVSDLHLDRIRDLESRYYLSEITRETFVKELVGLSYDPADAKDVADEIDMLKNIEHDT